MSHRPMARICVACNHDVAIADQYCPACGADTQSAMGTEENRSLWRKAENALPVALTLAVVALRVGVRLGRAAWFRQALSLWTKGSGTATPARNARPRNARRIHIRSRWVVRDDRGRERQGTEEHLIDIS